MSFSLFASLAIFVVTLALVILRPRNLAIGYPASAGAALCLALGVTSISDVYTIWGIVWNATFTFVAIIIISLVLDEAGFFEYLAIKFAKAAHGHGLRLFTIFVLLGAAVSAVFANDGTALILTPIVYALLRRSGVEERHTLPFIVTIGFVADSTSLPFVVSNLVNIVTSSYFGVGFLEYAEVMALPDAVAIVSSLVLLSAYYRRSIPKGYEFRTIGDPQSVIRDPLIFRLAAPSILALVAVYSVGGAYGVPVAFVAVPAAFVLLMLSRLNRTIHTSRILRSAPWHIVVFSLGMYVIVFGLGKEGFTQALALVLGRLSSLPGPLGVILSGYAFALMAAAMNNMPSVMLGNLAISHLADPSRLMYANVIGNDIGPKFTPIGSLATLLWLHTLERKGYTRISVYEYMKVGFVVGVPVLFFSLLTLWLV